jgi:SAM-dependent methyltransferase
MSFDSLIATSQRLNTSVEALAALAAELRIRQEGLAADPVVRRLLQQIVEQIEPRLLNDIDPQQAGTALAFIQAFFRQATDLLENPARPPGWAFDDPVVLQAQGQASRLVVRTIEMLAAQRPAVAELLRRPGAFLDVGSGVGWLAIEAARTWPAMKIVGIDPWEPAMALARKNLAEHGMTQRVELRSQSVEQLQDRDAFTLAWLAGPFIARQNVALALRNVHRALVPDGWLVFGLYQPPPSPLGQALTNLRIVRSGGHPWSAQEAEQQMNAVGYQQVETFPTGTPILMVVGSRPA